MYCKMNSRSLVSVLILLALVCHCSEGQQQRQSQQENRPRRFNGRQGPRIKRMYALCPPQFERIGNECYFLSKTKVNWLDAQFQCLDRDSKLAEPNKVDDRRLRKHLLNIAADDKIAQLWLGGKYDGQHKNWLWGYNGRKMKFQAFATKLKDQNRDADLQHLCTVMSRNIKYRWLATPCMEQHYFVCQHRMPVVKKDNIQHIYNMWNTTFPGQIANEIEVIFTNKDGDTRQRFQVQPEKNAKMRQRGWRRPYPIASEPVPCIESAESRRNSVRNTERQGATRARQVKRNEMQRRHQEKMKAREERRRYEKEAKFIE